MGKETKWDGQKMDAKTLALAKEIVNILISKWCNSEIMNEYRSRMVEDTYYILEDFSTSCTIGSDNYKLGRQDMLRDIIDELEMKALEGK